MPYGNTSIYYSAGSDSPNLAAITVLQETSMKARIVQQFATVAARDAAFAGILAEGAVGCKAYIVDRAGHCSYVKKVGGAYGWTWDPQQNIITLATRPSAAAVTGAGTPVAIINAAAVTLPPGNRLIRVDAATIAGNANAFGGGIVQPRAYVSGTNIPDGERWLQGAPVGGGYQYTLSRSFLKVCSGTVQFELYGIGVNGPDNVNFSSSTLTVIDCGPCDF